MYRRGTLLIGLIACLIGYFGPWVWHPAVVFRYSADDLAEFVKFMPAVQSGQVSITRELFFLPIWLASIGLALWLGSFVRNRVIRWLAGAGVIYAAVWPMPMYPFILDAYKSSEFGPTFWISVVVAILCAMILAIGSRLPIRMQGVIWAALGLAGAAIAPLHFVQLKPALDAQHGWTLGVGWGIVLTVVGFVVVAAAGVVDWRRA